MEPESYCTRRRLLVLAGVTLVGTRLNAANPDFWYNKARSQWTNEEIDRLITKSPWAKEVHAQYAAGQSAGTGDGGGYPGGSPGGSNPGGSNPGGGYPGGGGQGRSRGGIGGLSIPGIGGIGFPGGGGRPRNGGGTPRGGAASSGQYPMRKWLVLLPLLLPFLPVAGGTLHAALIKGTVVENQSGKPLARTLISVQPVPGSPGPTVTARTNTYGSFVFTDLPAGAYLLRAARRGFMPVQYGQKNWRAAGTPIVLDQDQSTFLYVRLPRFASISGIVVDENDVGLPEHEVAAFRNTRPPRLVARAQADDRGIYRIFGLDPGIYLVRTVGRQYEDGGYLPTFFRETQRVDEAGIVEAYLDQDRPDIRVRPFVGKLFNITGTVSGGSGQVNLTLVSDVGRETVITTGPFQFSSRPPGAYELYAEAPPEKRGSGAMGAYMPFALEHDMTGLLVPMLPMPGVGFAFQGVQGAMDAAGFKVLSKRLDLAGEAPAETLKLINAVTSLLPGRYLLSMAPSAGYVPMDFRGCRGERPEVGRADGWIEILVTRSCGVRYVVSNKPGGVHGTVTAGAHDPVAGAPVFLEPYDEITRKRVVDLRTAISDIHGQFQFFGLVPGAYRLVSTFEYQSPETYDIDVMTPHIVKVEEGRDQQQDVNLFAIR